MIPISEINHFANQYQVSAETIEKDYVISWILFCLSRSEIKKQFVFYGGTAIKRMYFEEHRFSEDVDWISENKFSQKFILNELTSLNMAKEMVNLTIKIDENRIFSKEGRFQLYLQYEGYDEIINLQKEIRIDFVMDREIFGQVIEKRQMPTYSDLTINEGTLKVMSLNTILANKLGLLMDFTRNEPRDLFDIWFLLNRRDQFDFNIKEIGRAFKEKNAMNLSCSLFKSHLKSTTLKRNWIMRLSKQLAYLPDVESVAREVKEKLEQFLVH